MGTNVFFNSRDELFRVNLSYIVYFEADGNYTRFVSANGLSNMIYMNLGKIEEFLSLRSSKSAATQSFARVGKSYIINLKYIYSVNTLKQELILSDQHSFSVKLPLPKIALKKLKELISPIDKA